MERKFAKHKRAFRIGKMKQIFLARKFQETQTRVLGPVYTGRNSEPWQARQSIGGVARVVSEFLPV